MKNDNNEEELRREKEQELRTVGLIAWTTILAWVFIIWAIINIIQVILTLLN